MGEMSPSPELVTAWRHHRAWSQAAGRLKSSIERAQQIALALAIITAVIAVAAEQLHETSTSLARVAAAGAAITAGLATLVLRRLSSGAIRAWSRGRSASEGLKSEVFSYLSGATAYTGTDRDRVLSTRQSDINQAASYLLRHTLDAEPDDKPLPAVTDVDSYVQLRLDTQIEGYYRARARVYQRRLDRYRVLGDILGVLAVVLAGLSVVFADQGYSAWVPVITTASTSVVAYVAATRLDFQVIEFLRTAQHLQRLRADHQSPSSSLSDAAFVQACEEAISTENKGWMARWVDPAESS